MNAPQPPVPEAHALWWLQRGPHPLPSVGQPLLPLGPHFNCEVRRLWA